jgi:outer membrane autotransporter protein
MGDATGFGPLVDVDLIQDGSDFFLISAPNASAFDPLAIPTLAGTLWYQSADEVLAETHKPATTEGVSFWGDVYYSQDEIGGNNDADDFDLDLDDEMDVKRHGIQLGVDYGFGGGARIGLTGGYAWAKADTDNDLSDVGLKAKGWNIGVYGQFGGVTGFHGEFLAKHDRYDAEFDDGVFDGEEFDIRSTGVDGALGYRFGMGGAATIDASVGLSHVRTKIDDINAFGFNYDIGKLTSTRGRAGIRAVFGGGWAPYLDGTVYREFDGDADFEVFDGGSIFDLDTDGKATWFRLEAGLSGNDGPGPILAAWADLGDKQGFGVRAGWRLGGGVREAAPPPPPAPYVAPPAPPPPATQTCPDGSVILATDMCPPPPPPPPPPPEPERG